MRGLHPLAATAGSPRDLPISQVGPRACGIAERTEPGCRCKPEGRSPTRASRPAGKSREQTDRTWGAEWAPLRTPAGATPGPARGVPSSRRLGPRQSHGSAQLGGAAGSPGSSTSSMRVPSGSVTKMAALPAANRLIAVASST